MLSLQPNGQHDEEKEEEKEGMNKVLYCILMTMG